MRKLFGILFLSLLLLGFNGVREASSRTIFNDNFDAYQQYLFPTIGDWQLLRDGSGVEDQYVDTLNCVSNTQSLHLAGASCWISSAYHAVLELQQLPAATVTLTANVRVGQNVACGCNPVLAELALFNLNINPATWNDDTWGTRFGGVSFNCDGFIYGGVNGGDVVNGALGVRLQPFNPNTWYNIRIDLNMATKFSRVFIDNVPALNGIEIPSSLPGEVNLLPTGVILFGGFAINNPVWYDDVCVFEPPPTPAPAPAPAPVCNATGLLHIPCLDLFGEFRLLVDMELATLCAPPDICFRVIPFDSN